MDLGRGASALLALGEAASAMMQEEARRQDSRDTPDLEPPCSHEEESTERRASGAATNLRLPGLVTPFVPGVRMRLAPAKKRKRVAQPKPKPTPKPQPVPKSKRQRKSKRKPAKQEEYVSARLTLPTRFACLRAVVAVAMRMIVLCCDVVFRTARRSTNRRLRRRPRTMMKPGHPL